MPHMKDEMYEAQANIVSSVTHVGERAKDILPVSVDASPATANEYRQSVADTATCLAAVQKIIYKAAFQFHGILAANNKPFLHRSRWHAYKIKSSTKVKEPFVQYAATKYGVITQSLQSLHNIYLVHINYGYVKKGVADKQLLSPLLL
jgi:sulfur carrier protein ThiS